MEDDFTKSDRKRIRQLADLAWERGLRIELRKIAVAMEEMESGRLTPFDVTDRIHKFHDGASRDLYNQFSISLPWLAVCRAYFVSPTQVTALWQPQPACRPGAGLSGRSAHLITGFRIQVGLRLDQKCRIIWQEFAT